MLIIPAFRRSLRGCDYVRIHRTQVNLRAYFLKTRHQGLDVHCLCGQVGLQFGDSSFLFLNSAALSLGLLVLFQELIQQHRVY